MREITANPRITIPLGRQGENNAVRVKFPISNWDELYGSGAFELVNVRPKEKTPYTCSITADDDFVYWMVQSADVAIVGHGKCELTYVVDGTIAKSVTFGTCVLESVEGAGEVPAPYESRIAELIAASAGITQDADRAVTAKTSAEEAAQEAQRYAEEAGEHAEAATHAEDFALDSEAWAVGKRNGVDVGSDDETFHNNSGFYANMAKQIAVNNGFATLWIDDDGILYLARTQNIVDNLDFRLTADGELEAIIYG